MHGAKSFCIGVPNFRLLINLLKRIKHSPDQNLITFLDSFQQLRVDDVLTVPKAGPWFERPLCRDHLELTVSIEVLVDVGALIFHSDVLFDIMDAQVLILFHIVDELHFIWRNCESGPQTIFSKITITRNASNHRLLLVLFLASNHHCIAS